MRTKPPSLHPLCLHPLLQAPLQATLLTCSSVAATTIAAITHFRQRGLRKSRCNPSAKIHPRSNCCLIKTRQVLRILNHGTQCSTPLLVYPANLSPHQGVPTKRRLAVASSSSLATRRDPKFVSHSHLLPLVIVLVPKALPAASSTVLSSTSLMASFRPLRSSQKHSLKPRS